MNAVVVIITAAVTSLVVGAPLVLYAFRLRVERNAARDLISREVDAVAQGVVEWLAKEADKRRGQA